MYITSYRIAPIKTAVSEPRPRPRLYYHNALSMQFVNIDAVKVLKSKPFIRQHLAIKHPSIRSRRAAAGLVGRAAGGLV